MTKRWYEIEMIVQEEQMIEVGRHKAFIRGPIEDLLVLQVDNVSKDEAQQVYQQAMTVLEMGGVKAPVAMMSNDVRFVRLVPVRNPGVIAQLDAKEQAMREARGKAMCRSILGDKGDGGRVQ
jgi:hypothetical protein